MQYVKINKNKGTDSTTFAQAAAEQDKDPAAAHDSEAVKVMPESVIAWLGDMKERVMIDPTATINISSLGREAIPTGLIAGATQVGQQQMCSSETVVRTSEERGGLQSVGTPL